ncbi:hypothetical protein [Nocardiopsis sp. HUAS JQ3]|nr:hypothetical protein [Nocardiopsis sp. HUAS JQ3]WDZ92116.1 hypothetical protein PV789_06130 [Nocardiopsis sp. HUAS JQ3]
MPTGTGGTTEAGRPVGAASRHRGLQRLDELGLSEIGGQAGMGCS